MRLPCERDTTAWWLRHGGINDDKTDEQRGIQHTERGSFWKRVSRFKGPPFFSARTASACKVLATPGYEHEHR